MIAVMGFSVCCAIGVQWASKKHPKAIWACLTVLVVDGFLFGGLALRPPTSRLPSLSCLDVVSGPVLVWPYDALDGEKSTSQRYQMVHQQPAAHTGIASWRLLEDKRIEQELRGIGIRQQTNRISSQRLYALGYRWLLVDQMATPILGESSDVAALGRFLGSRSIDCGDHVVYEIPRRDQVGGAK